MSRQIPDDTELFIVTGDQDAMQLVDGNVKVLRTTRGVSETKTYGRDEVVEELQDHARETVQGVGRQTATGGDALRQRVERPVEQGETVDEVDTHKDDYTGEPPSDYPCLA